MLLQVITHMYTCEFVCFLIHYHLAGADYSSTTRILTLNGNHSRIWVLVPIVLDEFTELNEQFRASLSLVDDNGINVSVHPDQSTVEIINDDSKWESKKREGKGNCFIFFSLSTGVIIGFVEDSVTVNEDDLLANLPVGIINGSLLQGVSILVKFSTNDATAHCKC